MSGRLAIDDRSGSPRSTTRFLNSAQVWLALVAFLVLVEAFILFVGAGLETDPRVSLFSWPFLIIYAVAGLVGIWFSHQTGFPAAWDPAVSNRQRFVMPALAGLGVGLLTVLIEQVTHGIQVFLVTTGLPAFNAPFPGSILFYPGGAIIVELIYRLLPIPLVLWLVSNVLLGGRAERSVFIVLALLTSLLEPMSQGLSLLESGYPQIFAAQAIPGFALNLTQAVIFRKFGFLAAIVVRVADYLVWHIIYGNLICNC